MCFENLASDVLQKWNSKSMVHVNVCVYFEICLDDFEKGLHIIMLESRADLLNYLKICKFRIEVYRFKSSSKARDVRFTMAQL